MSYAPVPSAWPDGELKYEGQAHPPKPAPGRSMVLLTPTWPQMSPRAARRRRSGLRLSPVPSAAQPEPRHEPSGFVSKRPGDGPSAARKPPARRMQAPKANFGRAWAVWLGAGRARARTPRWESGTGERPRPRQIGTGTGESPRFRTNRGRGRGSVPVPGQIGTVPGTVPDCRRVPSSRTLIIVGS